MDNWQHGWWRSTFSEADGSGSNARLCIFLVITVSLAILFYLAVRKPDTFIASLGLLTAFDTAVCGCLYGLNKGSDVVAGLLQKKSEEKKDAV